MHVCQSNLDTSDNSPNNNNNNTKSLTLFIKIVSYQPKCVGFVKLKINVILIIDED